MQQIREGADQPPGRRRLQHRPIRIPDDERAELYQLLNDYTEALDERLDDGLRSLHRSAQQLMRQLAAEVWRAGGPTAGKNLRENVIAALAQDDTIKGLLAHTDERFQSLRVRMAEMEGAVRQLAEATREAVRRVNKRAQAVDEALASAGPGSAEAVETAVGPLTERMGQLAAALGPITERLEALEPMARRLEALGAGVEQLQQLGPMVAQLGELTPVTDRLDSVETSIRTLHEGQREDLRRFAERTATAMGEATRRIREGVAGDIQALEAAVRSETAFAGAAAEKLTAELEGIGERTGAVLDAVRGDLAGRIEALERGQREHLEAATRAQEEQLVRFTERATAGLSEVSKRLREELREAVGGFGEGQAEAAKRLGAVQDALGDQHARLEAFTERAGQGLAEVSKRIQDGFRAMSERAALGTREAVEGSERRIRQEVAAIERALADTAARTGTVLEAVRRDVEERIGDATKETKDQTLHLVTQVVTRQAGQQARNLEAITGTLKQLLDSIREAGQEQAAATERVLRAAAGRQEALLTETLGALRSAIDEVSAAYAKAEPTPERSVDAHAFSRRLRGIEQRLTQLSAELAGGAGL